MKQFNIVPFLFSAIKDVANSMANTYKRVAEYELAKAKLEIVFKELDLDVIESEQKSKYEINKSSKRKVKINSLLDCHEATKEFDDNILRNLIDRKAKLEEVLFSDSDIATKEKAVTVINKINDYLNSYIVHDLSNFENMVEDIVSSDQTDNDNRNLRLEYSGQSH